MARILRVAEAAQAATRTSPGEKPPDALTSRPYRFRAPSLRPFSGVSSWIEFESERAFRRATRGRRRVALMRRLRRACADCGRLAVACPAAVPRRSVQRGVHEIPLEEITATVEPNRAAQFDREFRPAPP